MALSKMQKAKNIIARELEKETPRAPQKVIANIAKVCDMTTTGARSYYYTIKTTS